MSRSPESTLSVGIRLGFTSFSVAIIEPDGAATTVPNQSGEYSTPCCLAMKAVMGGAGERGFLQSNGGDRNETLLIGEAAVQRSVTFPGQCIRHASRQAFALTGGPGELESLKSPTRGLPPAVQEHVDIVAHLLYSGLSDVARVTGQRWAELTDKRVVLAIPPTSQHYVDVCELAMHRALAWMERHMASNGLQRSTSSKSVWDEVDGDDDVPTAAKKAAAEWRVGFVSSATAALSCKRLLKQIGSPFETGAGVAVVRIGGTSHSVSIAKYGPDGTFAVLGAAHDYHVGADRIEGQIVKQIEEQFAEDFVEQGMTSKQRAKLMLRSQTAKHLVSGSGETADIEVDTPSRGPQVFPLGFTAFTKLCGSVVSRVQVTAVAALEATSVDVSEIHAVIVHGGGANVPLVESRLKRVFPGAKAAIHTAEFPLRATAEGAAFVAKDDKARAESGTALPKTVMLASSGSHGYDETRTGFALMVLLDGGSYGVLLAPGLGYPARVSRQLFLPAESRGALLHLIATRSDFQTVMCEVGSCPLRRPPSVPGDASDVEHGNAIELYVEVCAQGIVRCRVEGANGSWRTAIVLGPFPELSAEEQ